MVVLCGSILQERMSEWVQCPVNVCFAFNSDQIADIARRQFGADFVAEVGDDKSVAAGANFLS